MLPKTLLKILADSDQVGNDSVYRALIKYIGHLARKAKRKFMVYYHRWRERREEMKAKKQDPKQRCSDASRNNNNTILTNKNNNVVKKGRKTVSTKPKDANVDESAEAKVKVQSLMSNGLF
uniref:Uncharacterized protein n=1 Tax=Romanomermis culicivorax TaxID=13658 RepID=A0A915JE13_ROMCU